MQEGGDSVRSREDVTDAAIIDFRDIEFPEGNMTLLGAESCHSEIERRWDEPSALQQVKVYYTDTQYVTVTWVGTEIAGITVGWLFSEVLRNIQHGDHDS